MLIMMRLHVFTLVLMLSKVSEAAPKRYLSSQTLTDVTFYKSALSKEGVRGSIHTLKEVTLSFKLFLGNYYKMIISQTSNQTMGNLSHSHTLRVCLAA